MTRPALCRTLGPIASVAHTPHACSRTWTGALYLEMPTVASGKLFHNTLGPFPGRYLSPFALSGTPGYNNSDALMKYDLTKWNQTYFDRLDDFVSYAAAKGVIVNLGLFSNMYGEESWSLSPANPSNNVTGIGVGSNWTDVYSGIHEAVTALEVLIVQKFAAEMSAHDNVYFEVINEPYIFSPPVNVTAYWRDTVIAALHAADAGAGNPHTI